jgi:hypothetical protein
MDEKTSPPQVPSNSLHVVVTRDQFSSFYTIWIDEQPVEELEIEEVTQWFKERGANMDMVKEALDHCWNFVRSEMEIENPKEPSTPKLPYAPDIYLNMRQYLAEGITGSVSLHCGPVQTFHRRFRE